jgi:multidrug efflux pump
MAIVIVIFGAVGLSKLGIREYPAIDPPVITIQANYRGATAEVVESQITEPIEEAINTVAGIKTLTSTSRDGAARIRLEFALGTDLDAAANDVRDQLSRVVRFLPVDADPPGLSKADADSGAVITFVLKSSQMGLMQLTEVADQVKEQLQTIPEVGSVDILGEKRYSIKILLDPDRLAAHGLTASDIAAVIRCESIELPGGRIENRSSELNIQTLSRMSDPDEFSQLIVLQSEESTVRLREIARVSLAPFNERISFTVGGVPMLGITVQPQPGANQIAIVDEAMRRLESLRQMLPEGVSLDVASDNTRFVRQAISELRETIFIALALVIGVIALFLGSLRVTFIPAVVIPISLTGAFFIMYVAGFSINVLTLLGLVLAVGLVVDDAIVVVENIHRRREQGLDALAAGVEGTREVFAAVIATTLTLIAVFSPILFLQGLSGRLFREFGFVIGGAVVISSFIALTLTPMMASRISPADHNRPRWWLAFDSLLEKLRHRYRDSLSTFIRRPWAGIVVLMLAALLVFTFYHSIPKELAPLEDRNALRISATAPEGVSYDYMLNYMQALEIAVNEAVPEATVITTQVPGSGARTGTGVANTGIIAIVLKPKDQRVSSQAEIAARLTRLGRNFPGARINVSQEPSVGDRRGGNSAQIVLRSASPQLIKEVLDGFMSHVSEQSAFSSVDVDLKFTRPELQVSLDRDRMQSLGISANVVAATLQAALSEQRVAYFTRDGRQYEILQQLAPEFRNDTRVLDRISVRTGSGQLVPLANIAKVEETVASPQRFRYNRQASATVSARLAQGTTLGEAIDILERIADEMLPEGITTSLTGASAEYRESAGGMLFGFGMALVFVFLILAAQFESWRAPLVILLTVPLALLGALLALWYFRATLNIFSQIGIIMLVGLITKNGILLVEFSLQMMKQGLSPREAVTKAADTRLRPILMTTISTALGVLPIALALGAGAEGRVSMGIAVIGGLLVGSCLTLFVIPALFIVIMGNRSHRSEEVTQT